MKRIDKKGHQVGIASLRAAREEFYSPENIHFDIDDAQSGDATSNPPPFVNSPNQELEAIASPNLRGARTPYHILMLEDTEDDALLVERELRLAGVSFSFDRVETREEFIGKIEHALPDAILADFTLPNFTALDALQIIRDHRLNVPFIVVTGSQSDETAAQCIKAGADDYVLKMSLKRLPNALVNALSKHAAVREKKRLDEALRAEVLERRRAEERLENLSHRLLQVQERERRHIARELHDEIGQALSALKINLQAVARDLNAESAAFRLKESVEIVDQTVSQVRNLSLDLRPSILDDLGIVAALRWYLDRVAQRAGFQASLRALGVDQRLPDELETTCFRIAQEALTNIVRHSHARSVEIELCRTGTSVHLIIRDDGVGFDLEAMQKKTLNGESFGISGMQERVALAFGIIKFKTLPNQGTEIIAHFPCPSTP